jgi:hypothetical protein
MSVSQGADQKTEGFEQLPRTPQGPFWKCDSFSENILVLVLLAGAFTVMVVCAGGCVLSSERIGSRGKRCAKDIETFENVILMGMDQPQLHQPFLRRYQYAMTA